MIDEKFGISHKIIFERREKDFPPVVTMRQKKSSCKIALYGAQILSYLPSHDTPDLLWLSPKAYYQNGKAIRGGIPICFPWFASYASPAHGFARISVFEVVSTGVDEDGSPHISLQLQSSKERKKQWNHSFKATLFVKLSEKLEVHFSVTNEDKKPFNFTEALHSYFHISDVSHVTLKGLENASYHDSLLGIEASETETVMIDKEIDRIYHDSGTCIIEDSGFGRRIMIEKEGSADSVVWNPWVEKSSAMSDMPENAYREMLCVESANTAKNMITLQPQETHTMKLKIYLS